MICHNVIILKIWKELGDGWCILYNELGLRTPVSKWKNGTHKDIECWSSTNNHKIEEDRWVVCRIGGKEVFRGCLEDCLECFEFESGNYMDFVLDNNELTEKDKGVIINRWLR